MSNLLTTALDYTIERASAFSDPSTAGGLRDIIRHYALDTYSATVVSRQTVCYFVLHEKAITPLRTV